jgi:electron transfer flavoprotein alpha subunit
MKVLVWAEHDNASLKDATLSAVTAGLQLGEVTLLVAGSGCAAVADAGAKVAGVSAVLLADDAAYGAGLAENVAPLVAGIEFDAFVAPATTTGKNIAPRVAALLDVMQISDILSVEGRKASPARFMPGTLSRRLNPLTRSWLSPCVPPPLPRLLVRAAVHR